MLLFVLFLLVMVLPGMFILRLFGLRDSGLCLSVALSYAVTVLVFSAVLVVGKEVSTLYMILSLLCLALLIATYLSVTINARIRALVSMGSIRSSSFWIPISTSGAVVGYCFWAGSYTEIPADVWRHFDQINDAYLIMEQGKLVKVDDLRQLFGDDVSSWYSIAAFYMQVSGASFRQGVEQLAAANTILFSLAVYGFALYVLRGLIGSPGKLHSAAALSVFFFFTTFGVNVFSYVRYYVFGPAFLGYVLYLSVVLCLLKSLRNESQAYKYLILAFLFALATLLTHRQEAIFMAVMVGLIIVIEATRRFLRNNGYVSPSRLGEGWHLEWRAEYLYAAAAMVVGTYMFVHVYAHLSLPAKEPTVSAGMVNVNYYFPFLQHLYILNPPFKFYQVVTFWGVVIYILFLLKLRVFKENEYILAGMLAPFVTVFNPLFTDLFLHFAPPTLLYRVAYVLPLPFMGAYFTVRGASRLAKGPGVYRRLSGATVVVVLVVFLMPITTTYFVSPFSKLYTLQPVARENTDKLWNDLFKFLNEHKKTGIVTDSVTGYVTNGLTHHEYPGVKFYVNNWRGWLRVNEESYSVEDFEDKKGWLVIINQRDGAPSEVGRISGHWPEDVMKVSKQYSTEFVEFVRSKPEMFEEIWKEKRILVYRVI